MTTWRDLGPTDSDPGDGADDTDDVTRAFHLDWNAWYARHADGSASGTLGALSDYGRWLFRWPSNLPPLPPLASQPDEQPTDAPGPLEPRSLDYTAMDAAQAMERAGVLTPEAARAIDWFGAHGAVSAVQWDAATGQGWVTYCGRVYPVAAFNDLFAHTGYVGPDTASLDDPIEDYPDLPPWEASPDLPDLGDLAMGLAALPSEPLPPLAAAAVTAGASKPGPSAGPSAGPSGEDRPAGCAGLLTLTAVTVMAAWLIGMAVGALVALAGNGLTWLIGWLATPR